LARKYRFRAAESEIDVIDGGTLAQTLTPIIAAHDYVVIFDCISADNGAIGDVYFFDYEDVPAGVNWQGSAHEVEMLQTLAMMDLVGDRPPVKIIGVIPERVGGATLQMTAPIQKSAIAMEKTALNHLTELGFSIETIEPTLTIQQVADAFGRDR
jgi:hydrogenase maturation protease